jgi:hypothetical protein
MDRQTFRALVNQEIGHALEDLLPDHAQAGEVSRLVMARRLHLIAERVESAARSYYLHNLTTVEELADEIGVSEECMRRIAQARHERCSLGRKFGDTWVWAPDEVEVLRPGGE